MTTVRTHQRDSRSGAVLAALGVGVPLGVAVLFFIHYGPFRDSPYCRYFTHPVEKTTVVLFFCALGALCAKVLAGLRERLALRSDILPEWDGKPAPVEEAGSLLAHVQQLPRRLLGTALVRRVTAVLDFLCQRRTASDLDDQIRHLGDMDALAMEGSYTLVRFITWAIPMLGFLGTVLGITDAVAGVTPEKLEKNLNEVTDGLALAFDTTALALALTMVVMFVTFLVERLEQSVLDGVDGVIDRELAHRFERAGAEGGAFLGALRHSTDVVQEAMQQLVERQVALWTKSLREIESHRQQEEERLQDRFATALAEALDRSLQQHSERLLAMEQKMVERSEGVFQHLATLAEAVRETGREQQDALKTVAELIATQAEALTQVQAGEQQLARLQETLNGNLGLLVSADTLQQAVHTLTAAVHLLTARAQMERPVIRFDSKPGSGAAA